MLLAPPRLDVRAWFTLAVAAPVAMLTVGAAATQDGPAQTAGLWIAVLLAPTIALALTSLDSRGARAAPMDLAALARARETALLNAFRLTTAEACGVLLAVVLGVPLSGQSIACGLAVAALPLASAVVGYVVAPALWKLRLDVPERPLAPMATIAPVRQAPSLPASVRYDPKGVPVRWRFLSDAAWAPSLLMERGHHWLTIRPFAPMTPEAPRRRPLKLWMPADAVDPDEAADASRFDQALVELRNLLTLYRPKAPDSQPAVRLARRRASAARLPRASGSGRRPAVRGRRVE